MEEQKRAAAWAFFDEHSTFQLGLGPAAIDNAIDDEFQGMCRTYTLAGEHNGWPYARGVDPTAPEELRVTYFYRFEKYNQWMVAQTTSALLLCLISLHFCHPAVLGSDTSSHHRCKPPRHASGRTGSSCSTSSTQMRCTVWGISPRRTAGAIMHALPL